MLPVRYGYQQATGGSEFQQMQQGGYVNVAAAPVRVLTQLPCVVAATLRCCDCDGVLQEMTIHQYVTRVFCEK